MTQIKPMPLESSRLRLRSAVDGDAEILFETYFGSISSSRFLSRHPHSSVEQTEKFLKQWTCEAWKVSGQPFAWVIAKLEDSSPVGIFLVFPKAEIAEIHYGISEPHRGSGFATEACSLATNWLLAISLIQRVSTAVDLDHVATQRVLENAGFQKGEVLKGYSVLPAFGSQPRDAISYSKIKK